MELKLIRKYKNKEYTIGKLYIDNKYFSDTLEDTDRKLKSSMSESAIKKIKIPAETAIPTGTYEIDMNTFSPGFGNRTFYKNLCKGKVPRLKNVKGFDGILIHVGSNKLHTEGCILVGQNKIKGGLVNSKETFTELYNILSKNKESITITIE